MKYFVKFLSVEGKIKEGIKVRYSKGEMGFPDDVYTVVDNVKEKKSVSSVGGYGIKWNKGNYIRESDKKVIHQSAYLKIGYNISLKDLQIVELFLCSRDIKVGDEMIIDIPSINNHGEKRICVSVEEPIPELNEPITYHINNTGAHLKHGECFKIIGRISKEVTWVKEGDEFEENQLGWIEAGACEVPEIFPITQKEPKYHMGIGIKCPCCGTFK